MFLEIIFIIVLGLVALYALYSKTIQGRLVWRFGAVTAIGLNLIYYLFKIYPKTSRMTDGDQWFLHDSLYYLGLMEIAIMLIIGLVIFTNNKNKKAEPPQKEFPIGNVQVKYISPLLFAACIVLVQLTYARPYDDERELKSDTTMEKEKPKEKTKMITYKNTSHYYSLLYPSTCKLTGDSTTSIEIECTEGNHLKISFSGFYTFEKQMEDRKEILSGTAVKMMATREDIIGGKKATEMEYVFTDLGWHLHEFTIDLDSTLMILQTRSASEREHEENYPLFKNILKSVKFTK